MRRSLFLLVCISLFLASCKVATVQVATLKEATVKETTVYRAAPTENIQLWATYYYVPIMTHNETGIPLLDIYENELPLKLAATDWCTAAIQGSVYISKDDQVYLAHYAGRSTIRQYDCRECPKYKNYPGYEQTGKVRWGMSEKSVTGGSGLKLVPMKSIAVDPTVIPYKSVVYIPAAIGTLYTDEEGNLVRHDGYFLAADTGSMIKGNHIDVYIGTATKNPFQFVKSDANQSFQAFVVHNEPLRFELMYLHQ